MDWNDYVRHHYREDLRRFRESRENHYCICYMEPEELRTLLAELEIENPRRFIINAYLDSLLLAGVCCHHEHRIFDTYQKETGFHSELGQVGGLSGLKMPQQVLRAIDNWDDDAISMLRDIFTELLPGWVRAFDARVADESGGRHGAGRVLLLELYADPDVTANPEHRVGIPQPAIDAIREGLGAAIQITR